MVSMKNVAGAATDCWHMAFCRAIWCLTIAHSVCPSAVRSAVKACSSTGSHHSRRTTNRKNRRLTLSITFCFLSGSRYNADSYRGNWYRNIL